MLKSAPLTLILCSLAATVHVAAATSARAQDGPPDGRAKAQVLSVGQMSPADAALLTAHRADLVAAAQFHGYDLSSASWIQTQVACPYAPNFVIMHNVQLQQDGSISLFTALIPRGAGHVRIIPVLHHGAQALRVFGATPAQRRLIDEVISDTELAATKNTNGDWTTLAYCYEALGGAEPMPGSATAPVETTPILTVGANGRVHEMSFSAVGLDRFRQDWSIQFDNHGRVESIKLSARPLQSSDQVTEAPLPRSRSIPEAKPLKSKEIPEAQAPKATAVPAPQ